MFQIGLVQPPTRYKFMVSVPKLLTLQGFVAEVCAKHGRPAQWQIVPCCRGWIEDASCSSQYHGNLPSLKLTSPPKMVVSNSILLFQGSIFRCYVSFREGSLGSGGFWKVCVSRFHLRRRKTPLFPSSYIYILYISPFREPRYLDI